MWQKTCSRTSLSVTIPISIAVVVFEFALFGLYAFSRLYISNINENKNESESESESEYANGYMANNLPLFITITLGCLLIILGVIFALVYTYILDRRMMHVHHIQVDRAFLIIYYMFNRLIVFISFSQKH